jgi:peptide/nickel transport system ATP-binding protein/oligopeptide transport system ATP-binding protein
MAIWRPRRRRSLETLSRMGLPHPEQVAASYPFHLSGGMCQRVMIAIATALNPKVLIADEPTSALDGTVQAAILHELEELRLRHGTSILLITHDLGVVAQMAQRVAVMYAGSIVESGDSAQVFQQPRHPYTWALLSSRPRLDRDHHRRPLPSIPGAPPNLMELGEECPFVPRCPKALNRCRQEPAPPLAPLAPHHLVACYNPVQHEDGEA